MKERGIDIMIDYFDSGAIRGLMLNAGVGVSDLARQADLSPSTISKLSRVDTRARIPTLGKLSRALNVPPSELLTTSRRYTRDD